MAKRKVKKLDSEIVDPPLSPRQERLVTALLDPNIKTTQEAALAAGYTPNTAKTKVYALVRAPQIRREVERRRERALAHSNVTIEEIIGRAAENMRLSLDDCLDKDGVFDIKKARRTGAIDYLKKVKIVTKQVTGADEIPLTIDTYEIEAYSASDARKELAGYLRLTNSSEQASNALLQDFKRLSGRIIEEAILQQVSEREMAEFFLSDERAAHLDPEMVRLIEDRFLR